MQGFLKREGAEIAYRVHGALGRDPVLLIRPLGGSMRLWGTFEEHIARRHTVVVFDHAGSGVSRGNARLSIAAMTSDALAVVESVGCARVHVFGLSLGGMIALDLVRRAPNRTASLCLAATPLVGWRTAMRSMAFALEITRCFMQPKNQVEVCLLRFISEQRSTGTALPWLAKAEFQLRANPSKRSALLRHGIAAAMYSGVRALASVEVPTLVMVGNRDPFVRVEEAQDVAARFPKGRCEVLEGAGHDLTLECPEETATRLVAFLDTLHG